MIYDRLDVVMLPFPFSDKLENKRRPVVILSSAEFNATSGHVVTAMVTSAKRSAWPLDLALQDYSDAGLPVPCWVGMKFFTASQTMIIRKLGALSDRDGKALRIALKKMFGG